MAAVTAILHSPAAGVTWAANQQQGAVCYSPVGGGEWDGKSRGSGVEEKCGSKKDGVVERAQRIGTQSSTRMYVGLFSAQPAGAVQSAASRFCCWKSEQRRESALGGPSLLRVLHRGEMGRLLNIFIARHSRGQPGKILIAQRQTRYFARNGCNVGSGGCKSIPVSFKDYLVC